MVVTVSFYTVVTQWDVLLLTATRCGKSPFGVERGEKVLASLCAVMSCQEVGRYERTGTSASYEYACFLYSGPAHEIAPDKRRERVVSVLLYQSLTFTVSEIPGAADDIWEDIALAETATNKADGLRYGTQARM